MPIAAPHQLFPINQPPTAAKGPLHHAYGYLIDLREHNPNLSITPYTDYIRLLNHGTHQILHDTSLRARRSTLTRALENEATCRSGLTTAYDVFTRRYSAEGVNADARHKLVENLCAAAQAFHADSEGLKTQVQELNDALSANARERVSRSDLSVVYDELLSLRDTYAAEDREADFVPAMREFNTVTGGWLNALEEAMWGYSLDLAAMRLEFEEKAGWSEGLWGEGGWLFGGVEAAQLWEALDADGVRVGWGEREGFLGRIVGFWRKWVPDRGQRFERVWCFVGDVEVMPSLL